MITVNLTPAEKKYLGLLVGGLTPEEICQRNKISRDSLKTFFYRIRKKTGVKSNVQLVSAFLTKQTTTRM